MIGVPLMAWLNVAVMTRTSPSPTSLLGGYTQGQGRQAGYGDGQGSGQECGSPSRGGQGRCQLGRQVQERGQELAADRRGSSLGEAQHGVNLGGLGTLVTRPGWNLYLVRASFCPCHRDYLVPLKEC